MNIKDLLKENDRRQAVIQAKYNPITGEGCCLDRLPLRLSDFSIPEMFIPKQMFKVPLISKLKKAGSIERFITDVLKVRYSDNTRTMVIKSFVKVRIQYDFEFWAYTFAKIKNKKGGKNINFKLIRAQRKLLAELEEMRINNLPIRIILLKARQWGGSTLVQIYMAWIQLVLMDGWYSTILAQNSSSSLNIKAMYTKLLEEYPGWLLDHEDARLEFSPYEGSSNRSTITSKGQLVRDTVVTIGSAETPDSTRGGDSALVHYSEVALWKETKGKKPEDIIRAVSGGVLLEPLTLEVFESTANGTGNFFHTEWNRAKAKESDKKAVFVAWFEIDMYSKQFTSEKEKEAFADNLLAHKDQDAINTKTDGGRYYWYLWKLGATLEAINWYIHKRKGYTDHADMAAEFPSDDVEAFKHSGKRVFDNYKVQELREKCSEDYRIGGIIGDTREGKGCLSNIRFVRDNQDILKIWEEPDGQSVKNRYLTIVDVGGRSDGADYSDILVIDRYWMMFGGKPKVVAEWHGHIDHDLLAWKAIQIAHFFGHSLLVIEANTYETETTDGDHTEYILDTIAEVYDNLYSRVPADKIKEGVPAKWGFHTNRSTKSLVIDNLVKVIREQSYIESEKEACDEYDTYEKKQNGSFGAIDGKHDDRLMTRGIGLYICYCEMPLPKIIEKKIKITRKTPTTAATL